MELYFGGGSGHTLADRRYALALHLADGGDYGASADLLRQCIELVPHWPPFYFYLGEVLRQQDHKTESAKSFYTYLELDPEDKMGAAIKLALIGATKTPEILPEGYVRALFDQYAPKFEKCLVENLSYHIPEFIAEKVTTLHPAPFESLLDLGCGTGLAALQFQGRAHRMVGVDIAPGMVEQAHAKNIFAELHTQSIESYLADKHEKFALVLAADVFIYIGVLEKLFEDIAAHMKGGGLFAFSTQKIESGDWILGEDHRYAHSKNYIERCAASAGLEIMACDDVDLRLDAGVFIKGAAFVCAKSIPA